MTDSNNYRSIAISSLVMKLYDLVIIDLFKENLYFDDLQFGYQSEVSTTMCTWLATETISYFLRNGSEVFSCLMDMSKAFDTVQHSCLFKKLLDQGMPPIIVRFLLASYKDQKANVKWNDELSRYFQDYKWRETRGDTFIRSLLRIHQWTVRRTSETEVRMSCWIQLCRGHWIRRWLIPYVTNHRWPPRNVESVWEVCG